tara:strand:+ start:333 stop:761 length:429 start_codon:yes stop_codon:yes gene_type:complete
MIIGNNEYKIKYCQSCDLDHVGIEGSPGCVICNQRPKRPSNKKCFVSGCENEYMIDSQIHIEVSDKNGVIFNKENGTPVKIENDDIVEATARVFQAFYYIIGPCCEVCMNKYVGGFMVEQMEVFLVKIAVKRIEKKFLEGLV